jgi:type I restriction enzyme, S subunit
MINSGQMVPLKGLCEYYRDDIVDGPFGSNLKRADYTNSGIPVLKIQNIKPFEITLKKMDYVDVEKFEELKRHSYKSGDIIMTKLGAPLGASAIVEGIDDGLIVADLVRIRASKIDTQYLCYHLNSPITNDFINAQQQGATRPRVKIASVRDLPIYTPPLPEQKRIVAILDQAFKAIDQAQANIERNIKNAEELFQSKLNEVFTEGGEGWEEKELGKLGTLTSSKRIFKKEYSTAGVPFYRSKEIKELSHGREISLELYIPNKRYEEIKQKFGVPTEGDILLTAVGTIGEMYIVQPGDRFYFKDGNIMWLKDFKELSPQYLKFALTYFLEQLKALARGSAYSALTIEKLKRYVVPVPPINSQQKIISHLEEVKRQSIELQKNYSKKQIELDDLRKSILQRAFAGELIEKEVLV